MKILEKSAFFNNSSNCDKELLEKELTVLESVISENDLLFEKYKEYKEKHMDLSESFLKEFSMLNEQHYRMRSSLKALKFDLKNEDSKELLISTEKEVLNNIKNTFQSIIDKKEKIIHTYKLLRDISKEYLDEKRELVS